MMHFLDFWLIKALLSQNVVVAIYALFPQIFWDWKVESADFFAFRMYDWGWGSQKQPFVLPAPLTFILSISYLYLEVEVLFCGVKLATQFIGNGLLTSQILPSILDHWRISWINGWTVGINNKWKGLDWLHAYLIDMSLKLSALFHFGSFVSYYLVCSAKNITSSAALRRSISRFKMASFSISLREELGLNGIKLTVLGQSKQNLWTSVSSSCNNSWTCLFWPPKGLSSQGILQPPLQEWLLQPLSPKNKSESSLKIKKSKL